MVQAVPHRLTVSVEDLISCLPPGASINEVHRHVGFVEEDVGVDTNWLNRSGKQTLI